jgi:eukaryotic-like serine/threonine-protein kinase
MDLTDAQWTFLEPLFRPQRRMGAEALRASNDRDTQLAAALAFGRPGDVEQVQKLVSALGQSYPLDTVIQNYSLPTIRAAVDLQAGDPADAVEALRPTLRYDLAYPDAFSSFHPAYVSGLAYLQMGEGRLAAEFQKLIDHPGLVGKSVTGALSHLQLARAQVIIGDKIAARKSYEDFLILWKDADPDLPVYRQAKVEYASLRKDVKTTNRPGRQ